MADPEFIVQTLFESVGLTEEGREPQLKIEE